MSGEGTSGRAGPRSSAPTVVLVHGAGHTSAVWADVQRCLAHPSFAVDLPGRASRPADLTTVTVAEAAESVVADVVAGVDGDVVLVGHSVSGTVLPGVAARLGDRVRHLVFVAGVTAAHGHLPLEEFLPGQTAAVAERLVELRREHAGRTLEDLDVKVASTIDSLNLTSQPMDWSGLPSTLERTFVRCLQDPIQPRDMQARFARNCGAHRVIDIDAGHTPAVDAPIALAEILDRIANEQVAPSSGATTQTG